MMRKTLQQIDIVVKNELNEANKNYPMFRSPHEGFGVIYEEMVEAFDELDRCADMMDKIVERLHDNSIDESCMTALEKSAERTAAEMVQVAAMARKYKASMETWSTD